MKKLLIYLLILLHMVLFSGCVSSNSNIKQQESSQATIKNGENTMNSFTLMNDQVKKTKEILKKSSKEKLNNLIKNTYSQKDLLSKISFGGTDNTNTMLDWLDEEFPIECIRTFDDDSLVYVVYKLTEGGFLFIFLHDYDANSTKYANYGFIVKEPLTKHDFDSIKSGSTLIDVEKIDVSPKLFNQINNIRGLLPFGETYHMVKEGFIKIKYEIAEGLDMSANYNSNDFIVRSVEFVPNGSNLIKAQDELFYGSPPSQYFKYTFLPEDYPK